MINIALHPPVSTLLLMPSQTNLKSDRIKCKFCDKSYVYLGALKKHENEHEKHGDINLSCLPTAKFSTKHHHIVNISSNKHPIVDLPSIIPPMANISSNIHLTAIVSSDINQIAVKANRVKCTYCEKTYAKMGVCLDNHIRVCPNNPNFSFIRNHQKFELNKNVKNFSKNSEFLNGFNITICDRNAARCTVIEVC